MLEEDIEKLKRIMAYTDEYNYVGVSIFLITDEEPNYKIYRLNFQSNSKFSEALKESIVNISTDIHIYYYPECIRPDLSQELSYLKLDEIPVYQELINRINDFENTAVLNKRNVESIISKSKAYIVKYVYRDGEEDKEVFAFYKMTPSSFYKREKMMFGFDNDSVRLL